MQKNLLGYGRTTSILNRMSDPVPTPDVFALRPFVPAKDFELSLRFYTDLGFTPERYGNDVAAMKLGPFSFLLQNYYAQQWAENFMMQVIVYDLDAWWKRIEALDLATAYGVQAPRPPAVQPWGLTVAYVFDPCGVLWHFAQKPIQ
jgi:catechol 2,3-dioxygenase-like lactoylglutathione lyase family enzyme